MEYRELGRTGWKVSEVSFGAWAIGGDAWGSTDDTESLREMHRAVEELRPLVPAGVTLAQLALRWISMFPEVTAAIPGARTAEQAESNARAAELPPLPERTMAAVRDVYDRHVAPLVHGRW